MIRAGLKSPARQVMAAMWTDSSAQIQGVAVMEDSEAISQGVTTFGGHAWIQMGQKLAAPRRRLSLWRARHRTPLASGPHGYRFAEGIDAYACLQGLFAQPALGGKASVPGTWVVKDALPSNRGPTVTVWRASQVGAWVVDLEFDPVMRVSLEGRPRGTITSPTCGPRHGPRSSAF